MKEPTNADLARMFHEHSDNDERFQVATRTTDDNIEATLKRMETSIEELRTALRPLTEAYEGVLFGRRLLIGISGVVLALAAIGGGIIWVINAAIHK